MTSESSGGYERRTVTWNAPSDLAQSIDGFTVYSADFRQAYRLDETGQPVPLHTCQEPNPDHAADDDTWEWTCPECSAVYELHAEHWWERRGD